MYDVADRELDELPGARVGELGSFDDRRRNMPRRGLFAEPAFDAGAQLGAQTLADATVTLGASGVQTASALV